MNPTRIAAVLVLLLPAASSAQTVKFDPSRLSLRVEKSDWQLVNGRAVLKSFGRDRHTAREALNLIREVGLNEYGKVGDHGEFEYWLRDGAAPVASGKRSQLRPFDPRKAQLAQSQRIWYMADAGGLLFNFGVDAAAAKRAQAVCLRYGFNQLHLAGDGPSRFMVLYHDPKPIRVPVPTNVSPVRSLRQREELTGSMLLIPEFGAVGRKIPIERRGLSAVYSAGGWELRNGSEVLFRFGKRGDSARMAERILRDSRVTDVCRVGASGPWLLLSHGRIITGPILGPKLTRIEPERDPTTPTDDPIRATIRHFGVDGILRIPASDGDLLILAKSR